MSAARTVLRPFVWAASTVARWVEAFCRGEGSAPVFWLVGLAIMWAAYIWALVMAP